MADVSDVKILLEDIEELEKAVYLQRTALENIKSKKLALTEKGKKKIEEIEKEMENNILCFAETQHDAVNAILEVPLPAKHIEILTKKAFEFKSFKEIAKETGFTYGYVREIYAKTLEAIADHYEGDII